MSEDIDMEMAVIELHRALKVAIQGLGGAQILLDDNMPDAADDCLDNSIKMIRPFFVKYDNIAAHLSWKKSRAGSFISQVPQTKK